MIVVGTSDFHLFLFCWPCGLFLLSLCVWPSEGASIAEREPRVRLVRHSGGLELTTETVWVGTDFLSLWALFNFIVIFVVTLRLALAALLVVLIRTIRLLLIILRPSALY
jgi:hypothetical protein